MAMSQRTPSATCRHPEKLLHHGLPQPGVAVVELQDVEPAGEVGVPAVGDNAGAGFGLHPLVIPGFPLQVGLAPLDIKLGVRLYPGVVQGGVVGDEIGHELAGPGRAGAPLERPGPLGPPKSGCRA